MVSRINIKRLLFFIIFFSLVLSSSIFSNELDNLNDLGITAYETENYDLSATYFKKILDLDPTFYKAENNLGLVEFSKGNNFKAIIHFFRALKINKKFENPKNNLLNILKLSSKDLNEIENSIDNITLIGEISKKEGFLSIYSQSKKDIIKLIEHMEKLDTKKFQNSIEKIITTFDLDEKITPVFILLIKKIDETKANIFLKEITQNHITVDNPFFSLLIVLLANKTKDDLLFNKNIDELNKIKTKNKVIIDEINRLYSISIKPTGEIKKIIDYINKNQLFRAEIRLKKMRKKYGSNEDYIFLKSFIKYKQGMRAGARKLMSIFNPELVENPVLLEAAGTLLAKIGMDQKALKCFIEGTQKFSNNGDFFFKAAIISDKLKQINKSGDFINEALSLRPYSLKYKYFASQIFRKLGKIKEAEKFESEILKNDENSYESSMIRLKRGANSSDSLIVDWNLDIKKIFKNDVNSINQTLIKNIENNLINGKNINSSITFLYDYYSKNKKYKKVLVMFLLAQKYKLKLNFLPWTKAELLLKSGLPKLASKEYLKILENKFVPPDIKFNYGYSLYLSGKTDEAFLKWDKILNEDNIFELSKVSEIKNGSNEIKILSNDEIINNRTEIIHDLLLHRDKTDGMLFLKSNIEDGDIDSLLLYCELLMNKHKPDSALKIMKNFMKKNGNKRIIFLKMGDICYQVGSYEKALNFYKKSGNIDNFSARLLLRLGDMEIKLGRIQEGIIYYNMAKFKTTPGTLRNNILEKLKSLQKKKTINH